MVYIINVMAKSKLTTTGPLGLIATRTTARVYTHAVWIRITESTWTARLQNNIRYQLDLAAKYRADVANSGPSSTRWGSALVTEWAESFDKSATAAEARLAAGYEADTQWFCATWCGRADLAAKAVGTFSGFYTFISEVAA